MRQPLSNMEYRRCVASVTDNLSLCDMPFHWYIYGLGNHTTYRSGSDARIVELNQTAVLQNFLQRIDHPVIVESSGILICTRSYFLILIPISLRMASTMPSIPIAHSDPIARAACFRTLAFSCSVIFKTNSATAGLLTAPQDFLKRQIILQVLFPWPVLLLPSFLPHCLCQTGLRSW